jgi:hypothetical protein
VSPIALLALAPVLAGCGSGSTAAGVRVSSLAAAVDNAANAKTFQMSVAVTTSAFSFAETGSVNVTDHSSDFVIAVRGFQIETKSVGGKIYSKIPASEQALPNLPALRGKSWFVTSPIPTSVPAGSPLVADLLGLSTGRVDGEAALGALRTLPGALTVVGRSSVRGTPTTHYTVKLPASGLGKVGLNPSAALPVDLDIDPQGRLRRLHLATQPSDIAGGATDQVPGALTVELYGFGIPVKIEAPPAAEVADEGAGALTSPSTGPSAPNLGASPGRPQGYTGPDYPGMAVLDHLADTNGQAHADGFTLTVKNFSQGAAQVCGDVTYLNRGTASGQYDFFLDWSLRQPNGVTSRPNPNGHISSGQLTAGGSTSGQLCFDSTGQRGQFVLIWQPLSSGRQDRGIWLFRLP